MGPKIPGSRYSKVIENGDHPERSKIMAVEICNASQGIYEVRVHEHGFEKYRLDVTGNGQKRNESILLHNIARDGNERKYRFIYKVESGSAVLSWLDEKGQPQVRIENGEW